MISFEGGWCASNALTHCRFVVNSSIRCHLQTGQGSAYFLDRAAASSLSSRAAHHPRSPRRRMTAFSRDDGVRQAILVGFPVRHAALEARRATLPLFLPVEAIPGPLHKRALSTGPAAR